MKATIHLDTPINTPARTEALIDALTLQLNPGSIAAPGVYLAARQSDPSTLNAVALSAAIAFDGVSAEYATKLSEFVSATLTEFQSKSLLPTGTKEVTPT